MPVYRSNCGTVTHVPGFHRHQALSIALRVKQAVSVFGRSTGDGNGVGLESIRVRWSLLLLEKHKSSCTTATVRSALNIFKGDS